MRRAWTTSSTPRCSVQREIESSKGSRRGDLEQTLAKNQAKSNQFTQAIVFQTPEITKITITTKRVVINPCLGTGRDYRTSATLLPLATPAIKWAWANLGGVYPPNESVPVKEAYKWIVLLPKSMETPEILTSIFFWVYASASIATAWASTTLIFWWDPHQHHRLPKGSRVAAVPEFVHIWLNLNFKQLYCFVFYFRLFPKIGDKTHPFKV